MESRVEAGRVAVRKVVEAREVDRASGVAAVSAGRAAEARVADGDGGASELRRWRDPATDLHRWWVAGGRWQVLLSGFTFHTGCFGQVATPCFNSKVLEECWSFTYF